jgi:uncharacterized Zn-finger protein
LRAIETNLDSDFVYYSKLSTLLNENETQLNVENINEIKIERENRINESSDNNSCLSTIKVEPLSMPKSKRFKVASNIECTTSTQMNIHKRIHFKQKRFTCDQCQKTFAQINTFKRHKQIHTGEKPHNCEFCPMKFARSHHLTRHTRLHTGEKPYSCDICPKKFSDLSNLAYHKRIHTGEKPYSCDL